MSIVEYDPAIPPSALRLQFKTLTIKAEVGGAQNPTSI